MRRNIIWQFSLKDLPNNWRADLVRPTQPTVWILMLGDVNLVCFFFFLCELLYKKENRMLC